MILDWMGRRERYRKEGRRQGRDGRTDRQVDGLCVIAQGNHAGNALSDDELLGEGGRG